MAGKLIGLGAFANNVGTYGHGTHLGMHGLSGSGAGLDPTDPCYDPNNSWYNTLWTSDAECACMANNPTRYSNWQLCANWTPTGIANQTGVLTGGLVKSVVGGIVQGATPSPTDYSSYIGYGIAALVGIVILSKAL